MSYQTGINSTNNTSITHDAHNGEHSGNDSDDNDTFIINLRGVKIPITRTQIESDSPGDNIFASSLLGDFIESSSKTIKLDRNPGLFRIILDHLSGYTVLPLDSKLLKEYGLIGMSVERAIRYLLDDTEYYGFARFNALLNEELLRLQENEESYEEEMLSIKKQRLKIEKTRLKLDIKKANEATETNLNNRRLQLLQMNLDVELRRLQYQSIYAASRQTGANEYAVSKKKTTRQFPKFFPQLCQAWLHFSHFSEFFRLSPLLRNLRIHTHSSSPNFSLPPLSYPLHCFA